MCGGVSPCPPEVRVSCSPSPPPPLPSHWIKGDTCSDSELPVILTEGGGRAAQAPGKRPARLRDLVHATTGWAHTSHWHWYRGNTEVVSFPERKSGIFRRIY